MSISIFLHSSARRRAIGTDFLESLQGYCTSAWVILLWLQRASLTLVDNLPEFSILFPWANSQISCDILIAVSRGTRMPSYWWSACSCLKLLIVAFNEDIGYRHTGLPYYWLYSIERALLEFFMWMALKIRLILANMLFRSHRHRPWWWWSNAQSIHSP